MKSILTTIVFFAAMTKMSFAQCNIPNESFENWITETLVIQGPAGEVSAEAMIPDSITPFLRFFLIGFAAAFDQSIAQIVEDDPQGFLGVSQSTEASEGDFALQLQGGYDFNDADIYGINGCTEIPDTFYLDVKTQNQNGPDPDTLSVLLIFDEGIAPLPGNETEILNSPGGVFREYVYTVDTEYHTVAIPIMKNFDAPVDTFYYNIIATTHNGSSMLIDNLRFENEDSETCMFENSTPFSITGIPQHICFCDEFEEGIILDAPLNTSDMYSTNLIALGANDDILYVSEFDSGGFDEDDFCPDDVLNLVEIHYTDLTGLQSGSRIIDLVGCFELSEKLPLQGTFVEEFEIQLLNGTTPVEDDFVQVCLIDDIIEVFTFEFTPELNYVLLAIDEDETVIEQLDNQNMTAFENLTPGQTYDVGIVQHTGVIPNLVGQNTLAIFQTGECVYPSANSYEVQIFDNEGSCISSTQDPAIFDAIQFMENPVSDILSVSLKGLQNQDQLQMSITNSNGQLIRLVNLDGMTETYNFHTSSLSAGVYFFSIQSESAQATKRFVKL